MRGVFIGGQHEGLPVPAGSDLQSFVSVFLSPQNKFDNTDLKIRGGHHGRINCLPLRGPVPSVSAHR